MMKLAPVQWMILGMLILSITAVIDSYINGAWIAFFAVGAMGGWWLLSLVSEVTFNG